MSQHQNTDYDEPTDTFPKLKPTTIILPHFSNEIVNNINHDVGKKMEDIRRMHGSVNIPLPREEPLFIMGWTNFRKAYLEGTAHIWGVVRRHRKFLVVTMTDEMPFVPYAEAICYLEEGIVRIREFKRLWALLQHCSLLMKEMAVLMKSCQDYWLIDRFLWEDAANTCFRPTPERNPVLCTVIDRYYNQLLLTSVQYERLYDLRRQAKELLRAKKSRPDNLKRFLPFKEPRAPVPRAALKTHLNCDGINVDLQQIGIQHSNVTLRELRTNDVRELCIPQAQTADHRWVLLHLGNDSSHILLPDFGALLSLQRIRNAQAVASRKQSIIRIACPEDPFFDILVTPHSETKVYLGPLGDEMELPVMIMVQMVDGSVMRREVYQKRNSIIPSPEETTYASLLIQKNNCVQFAFKRDMPRTGHVVATVPSNATNSDGCFKIDAKVNKVQAQKCVSRRESLQAADEQHQFVTPLAPVQVRSSSINSGTLTNHFKTPNAPRTPNIRSLPTSNSSSNKSQRKAYPVARPSTPIMRSCATIHPSSNKGRRIIASLARLSSPIRRPIPNRNSTSKNGRRTVAPGPEFRVIRIYDVPAKNLKKECSESLRTQNVPVLTRQRKQPP